MTKIFHRGFDGSKNSYHGENMYSCDQGLERHLLGSHGLVTASMQDSANKGQDSGRCPVCGKVIFLSFSVICFFTLLSFVIPYSINIS